VEVGKSGKIMCEDLWVMIRAGPNGRLEEIWRENRIFTGENTCAQGPGGVNSLVRTWNKHL